MNLALSTQWRSLLVRIYTALTYCSDLQSGPGFASCNSGYDPAGAESWVSDTGTLCNNVNLSVQGVDLFLKTKNIISKLNNDKVQSGLISDYGFK